MQIASYLAITVLDKGNLIGLIPTPDERSGLALSKRNVVTKSHTAKNHSCVSKVHNVKELFLAVAYGLPAIAQLGLPSQGYTIGQ